MKKILYTLAIAGLFSPALSARTLSVDEAKANAAAFATPGMLKLPALQGSDLRLAGTIQNQGVTTLYLFAPSTDKGVIVASASSLTPAVLGYADSGSFSMDAMPPAMQAVLEQYSAEIAMAEAGQTMKVLYNAPAERQAIEPICKTQWNQNAPYNDLTPELSGQHCMTGCVATAMAQVMKVHEWPAQHGEGFVSYMWNAGAQQLSYNLANSTMDWANMLNTYDSDATDAQKQAVASLMRDCGYATTMQYSLTASGTTAVSIPVALYYNFGYDANVHTLQRVYYTLSEWEDIVYGELAQGCPVMITGVSNDQGGHCFVCDGYSSDRYFHINWGWGGMSDGYFLLSALNPETQGIGGSTGGFNNGVNICVGIKKPVEGSKLFTQILGEGNFTTNQETYSTSDYVTFSTEYFTNTSMETEKGSMGVKLTDAQGNVTYIKEQGAFNLDSYYYITNYQIAASEFPTSGTYTVTAAWFNTETQEWQDVMFPINAAGSLTLTVEDGQLNFAQIPVNADLEVTDVKLLTDIYTNTNFKISGNLVNNGTVEYYGTVLLALLDENDEVKATTDPFNVDVEGGVSQSLEMVAKFQRAPSAGTYNLVFATADGKVISEPLPVDLTAITGRTAVSITNLRMTSGNGGNPATVPSNNVAVAGTVNCTAGYFNNLITAYIFPQRGGNSLGTVGAENFFIHADKSQDFEFKGSFGNGVEGTTYMIAFFFNNTQIANASINFVLGEPTSVKVIETPEKVKILRNGNILSIEGADNAVVDVYSADGSHVMHANGVNVGISSLAPGAYIAVANTPEGVVMLKFVR
ncbi:MAG: C10 family peptidase [Prevotella sp.]|nr:C10 family peptidase [Prevotella sp.]MCM1074134.1 C10 family peptidase [Ruminococcus sp.]